MSNVVISGTGLFTPPGVISNAELVAAFNQWVAEDNALNRSAIEQGTQASRRESSADFIVKASGILSRHVMDAEGILDPERMRPSFAERPNELLSLQAEMGTAAARDALIRAGRTADRVDAVIVACSNLQRAYPAMAIEIQQALGIEGFAFDMNVACASVPFAIQQAVGAIETGQARAVLVVSPEICTAHLNFRDRDSHFIFGDAATALLLERADQAEADEQWQVDDIRLQTRFSSNIRNNAGFLDVCIDRPEPLDAARDDRLFMQEGRKVFKEVCPMVAELMAAHLDRCQLQPQQVSRFWLHQANLSMNLLIARRLLGREPSPQEVPIILDTYGNTSSAGSVIAFHLHRDDLPSGSIGVLCAFGAGYSAGSVILHKR